MADKSKIVSNKNEDLKDEIIALKLALKNSNSKLLQERESHAEIINRLSHDLKNPVGIIYSFIEMIFENGDNYNKEKLHKYLTVIKNSASFSIELLNNLAKYSSLLSSEMSLSLEKTNFTDLLKSVLRSFNKQLQSKNISLISELKGAEVFLTIDGHEVAIALSNILSNAIRYSPSGAVITVELIVEDNSVITKISDKGIGIEKDHVNAIFKEFYTINTYDEYRQKCVGLGLNLAEKIIHHHNGQITVESTFGEGATFSVELPMSS